MDVKHKEMQYLGTLEIFKETFKIINRNRKIFAMATICFIHPLNFILSSFMGTLNLLLRNLQENGNFSHLFSHKFPFFWPFNVFIIISLFCISIVSTVAVAHTVAAIYTGREPSPNDTMIALRKVWKRVLVTFLCVLVAFLVYNIIAGLVLFVMTSFGEVHGVFFVFYFVGLLYLVVVLQLSGVVSVLEETYGFKAMAKSMFLVKGKMAEVAAVVFVICLSFGILQWFESVGREMLLWPRMMPLMYALVQWSLLFLILMFLLWKLVLETMLYFVCKSYHNESIDMSAVSGEEEDHIPLRSTEC